MNYFSLFDMPVSLKVDQTDLIKKYYALSKQYHPDNYTLSDDAQQLEAEQMSATINEAKKILERSENRLQYLLNEWDVIKPDEKYNLSPQFLGEMMDINEQIMEYEVSPDEDTRVRLMRELSEMEANLFEPVRSYFEMDELKLEDQDYLILKDYYFKKKYLRRIAERFEG